MNIKSYELRSQISNLREKVLLAEAERISGAKTLSVAEARNTLMERLQNHNQGSRTN